MKKNYNVERASQSEGKKSGVKGETEQLSREVLKIKWRCDVLSIFFPNCVSHLCVNLSPNAHLVYRVLFYSFLFLL